MLKVMIAEDDLLMADMLEDVLVANGYEVCGVARTVEEGVSLGKRCKPDLALLDIRLADGGLGTEIAARLVPPGRPGILYATGDGTQIDLTDANGEAVIGKPYRIEDVVRALKIVEQIIDTGEASPPFPGGFHRLLPPPQCETPQVSGSRRDAGDVKQLLSQQAAFLSFACFAHGESDPGRVLTAAARVCAEIMGVSFCGIWRFRPDENDLRLAAVAGWPQGAIGSIISRSDENTPQISALITGQPKICADVTKHTNFTLPSGYTDQGIISILDVIIKGSHGQPWGLLEIASRDLQTFVADDIDFMTGFANVLAEAASSTKLNGVLQSEVGRMNDMIADKIRWIRDREREIAISQLALKERLVVTQELQHRVRNNLQLVYGMLSRQLQTATEPSARKGISAIARCVITLGRVYDHLLGTGLSEKIDFGAYLSSLCTSFAEIEDPQQPNVVLTCQAANVMLDLDAATALGLIVAELISNSYLHAFPHGKGTIGVSLLIGEPRHEATLTFADDGVGFQETGDDKRQGLGLVRRLIKQINGSVDLRSGKDGSRWTLRFPLPMTESKRDDLCGDTPPARRSLGLDLPVVDLAALGRISSLLKPVAIVHHLRALAGKCTALLHVLGAPDAFAGTGGALAEAAHALVGNSGMLGFQRLAFVARQFEDAVRTDPPKVASISADLAAALEATIEEIRNHTAVLAGSGEGALRRNAGDAWIVK